MVDEDGVAAWSSGAAAVVVDEDGVAAVVDEDGVAAEEDDVSVVGGSWTGLSGALSPVAAVAEEDMEGAARVSGPAMSFFYQCGPGRSGSPDREGTKKFSL